MILWWLCGRSDGHGLSAAAAEPTVGDRGAGSSREDDLAREIRAHLALLEDKFIAQGMTPADATLAARRAFGGGVEQVKERHRDARAFRWVADARKDAVYAVRSLSRSSGFTIAAIVTLSVGIGATTAIYSVVNTVLLQPLAFPDADRLVRIMEPELAAGMQTTTYQEYLEWRKRTTSLAGLAAATYIPQALMLTRQGTARVGVALVSTNYFEILERHFDAGQDDSLLGR